jgi:L,D-transpeptidase ErfK/SrfK
MFNIAVQRSIMRSTVFSLVLCLLGGTRVFAAEFVLPAENDALVGQVQHVITGDEDTLLDIGRRFGVGYEEMMAANPGVDAWVPGAGKRITVPTQYILPDAPRTGIVVNVAEHRLYYFPKAAPGKTAVVHTFPVSLGKEDWSTPHGRTSIVAKVTNPSWYPPASVRKEHADRGDYLPAAIPPGKDNPLGEFAMRMGFGGGTFLIHGTNKPTGIGMDVTHGCIRMFPEDIEKFFKEVPVGTSVLIVDQPYKMAWSQDRLYMEVHKSADVDERVWREGLTNVTRMFVNATRDRDARINWVDAEAIYLSASGMPAAIKLQN